MQNRRTTAQPDRSATYIDTESPQKNVNAWDVAISAWTTPNEDEPVSGYDRIIAEAGPEYTWEGILIDPSRPWAAELRLKHPEVVRNIEANLERREKGVTTWRAEQNAEAEHVALEKDEEIIALINANRAAQGQPPYSEHQEQMVRARRSERRAGNNPDL